MNQPSIFMNMNINININKNNSTIIRFEGAEPKISKPKNDISMSIARSIADPRAVRVQRVLDSGVLNMNLEKVTHYHSMPISSYDFYLGELKKNPSVLRQVGVPTDLEVREIETNTDEINHSDKQIQCCYGDDTEFYNLLKDRSKSKTDKQTVQSSQLEFQSSTSTDKDTVDDLAGDSAHRLSAFLQRSTQLFEGLLREESSTVESRINVASNSSKTEIFDANEKWIKLGSDSTNGANELIRLRQIVSIKFSKIQSNMLLVAHSYPIGEDAENDLRPFKVTNVSTSSIYIPYMLIALIFALIWFRDFTVFGIQTPLGVLCSYSKVQDSLPHALFPALKLTLLSRVHRMDPFTYGTIEKLVLFTEISKFLLLFVHPL